MKIVANAKATGTTVLVMSESEILYVAPYLKGTVEAALNSGVMSFPSQIFVGPKDPMFLPILADWLAAIGYDVHMTEAHIQIPKMMSGDTLTVTLKTTVGYKAQP